MKPFKQTKPRLAIQAGIAVVALTMLAQPIVANAEGQNGTTLSATKTATGFWEQRIDYDWTVNKTASPDAVIFAKGDTDPATVEYTIALTKTAKELVVNAYGASGEICVTNGGAVATENLQIVDNLQSKSGKGSFTTFKSASVDTTRELESGTTTELAAGEFHCYPYSIEFTPVPGVTYRNEAAITINNHSGYLGNAFGPAPKIGFSLPTTATLVETDAKAIIVDTPTLPIGFSVDFSESGPWTVSAATPITYTATITRSAESGQACGGSFYLTNKAVLTENDSKVEHNSTEEVSIGTPDCDIVVQLPQWCSPGYWRNHRDSWAATGVSPDTLFSSISDSPINLKQKDIEDGATATPTLIQVLLNSNWYGGENFNIVGDYLSLQHPDVNFNGLRPVEEHDCPLN